MWKVSYNIHYNSTTFITFNFFLQWNKEKVGEFCYAT